MQTPGGLPNPPSPGRPSPWICGQTNTCENITLPQTSFSGGIFNIQYLYQISFSVWLMEYSLELELTFYDARWKMKLVNATERQRSATLSGRIPSSVHDCLLNITSCGKWVKDAVGLTYKPQRSTFQLTQCWYLWDLFNMLFVLSLTHLS